MKISVIIPAYNEEESIRACLESISSQRVKPSEVIVVDNNSTDKTAQIAKKMGARVIEEKKQGLTHARNKGFNEAKGDILLRTDADTIVPHDWVEKYVGHFEDEKVGRVSGPAIFYSTWALPIINFLVFWVNEPLGYKALFGPNFAIRRKIWEKIKNEIHFDDELFHEDLDLAIHSSPFGEYVRDYSLQVTTSTRKLKNPIPFMIHYNKKWLNTIFLKEHRKLSKFSIIRNI